ncbi:amino acid permease [Salmonella enterica]|nr:amino acid permease [Salmonella enterica]EDI8547409.1 amino acid permease [Salmonella enterica]EDI8994650.1 amino acid permease [Salmonella enterica]EDI9046048.1 amino acid permease [Salmonella enterica]EDI9077527.1 amino acid permease [Salmonella enterica]
MSDTVSYIHAFITLISCALCKSTCASLLHKITCDIRKIRRFYAITIEKIAKIAWLYVTARR